MMHGPDSAALESVGEAILRDHLAVGQSEIGTRS